MHYESLSKGDYTLRVHGQLVDDADVKFSKVAMGMWDFMKAWDSWPVRTLWDDNKNLISVCFMKLSGQAKHKVLFISNIFTPTSGRGKGGAKEMLDRNIKEAVSLGASTIRLDCNKKALGFYDRLGMTYWGTTISYSMFCDLPINSTGVEHFQTTKNMSASEILNSYPKNLREAKMKWIWKKVEQHTKFDFGHPSMYNQFIALRETEKSTLPFT